jgi:hypothetical protein
MKHFIITFFVIVAILTTFGCQRNSPTAPAANTPNIAQTISALLSATARNFFSILSAKCEGVVYNFQPFA